MIDFVSVRKNLPAPKMKEEKKFYDQGWNARVNGEPFDYRATVDWKDGWRDCEEASEEDRVLTA